MTPRWVITLNAASATTLSFGVIAAIVDGRRVLAAITSIAVGFMVAGVVYQLAERR